MERLDGKCRNAEINWKTAENAWVLVRAMFRDAMTSKTTALRVRSDDPTKRVQGPDKGPEKSTACLYPSEFLRLAAYEVIPIGRRRAYALAVYTYGRAGEQEACAWSDVDLDARIIQIHRSASLITGQLGTTKGEAARFIPIEPNLLPLLRTMRAESNGHGPLVTLQRKKAAGILRRDLMEAGVDRDALFADTHDPVRKNVRFHDLRGTAATWMALRGDNPHKIQAYCGHKSFSTTELYINKAALLGTHLGEPFPPLPDCLLMPGNTDG